MQETETQSEKNSFIKEGYKISEDDALDLAESAAELFSPPTKSGVRTAQTSIPVVVENANGLDTLIYIVNYTDNNGYVLISPDARSGEILAFIDEGSLSIQDTVNNSLQKFLLDQIINYQAAQFEKLKQAETATEGTGVATKGIVGPEGTSGKTYSYLRGTKGNDAVCQKIFRQIPSYDGFNTPSGTLKPLNYYEQNGCYGSRTFSQLLTPKPAMLTTAWDQDAPFNDNAPLMANGKHSAAGCVAVAVAQIMAYHSFPTHYPNGTTTSIASLRKQKTRYDFPSNGAKKAIATFLRKIGDLLDNDWETVDRMNTYAWNSPVSPCFSTMGYKNPGELIEYNLEDVIKSLNGNMPVYTSGYSGSARHGWVIDGYKILNRGYDIFYFDENAIYNGQTKGELYLDETYLSCNFGWGAGKNDGYYLEGVFNANAGPIFETKSGDNSLNFSYFVLIIPYIHY